MIFLITNARGLTRAEGDPTGSWGVTKLLPERRINCLAADPQRPGTVFAGTQGDGVLRSLDGGAGWAAAGLAGRIVKAIAVSPLEAGVVYAGTKPPALFVSRDAGESWSELEGFRSTRRWYWFSPAETPGFQPYVQGLALSPADPDVVVAGIEAGAVVRSSDGGRSWSGHLRRADRDCHDLRFHHRDGRWVYQAGGGGPAVSSDGGRTWRHPNRGLGGSIYAMACAADPDRPEVWYLSAAPLFAFPKVHRFPVAHFDGDAHASIFRSTGAAPWERLGGGLPQPLDHMPYALVTDPQAPGHLYAGLSSGELWHSADYGDQWRKLPVDMGGVHRAMIRV